MPLSRPVIVADVVLVVAMVVAESGLKPWGPYATCHPAADGLLQLRVTELSAVPVTTGVLVDGQLLI